MAGKHDKKGRRAGEERPRRERLQDNYYYEDGFQDISSYSDPVKRRADRASLKRASQQKGRTPREAPRTAPRSGKKPRGKNTGRTVTLVVLLLVVGVIGLFAYMFMGLKVHPLSGDLGAGTGASGVKTIALFGVDSREGENTGRSDAVMILAADSRSHTLKLASIMRDTEVYIEGYGNDKLTHAYAYGGPELSVRTLNQNFNLDIEDYMTVNFFNMTEIVDAFGGVEVTLTGEEMFELNQNLWKLSREAEDVGASAPIKDSDYLTDISGGHNLINGEYAGGTFLLNGAQAVAYSRIRYIGGDGERTSRQHTVLTGLLKRAKERSIFSWPSIVHGVMPNCETSLDLLDIFGLSPMALGGLKTETATFPGENEGAYNDTNENELSVVRYDGDLMTANLRAFLYGE